MEVAIRRDRSKLPRGCTMSGGSRDSLFPATSIGRSHGQRIQRSVSPSPSLREPLTTHPLLSPSPSTNLSPTTTSPPESSNSQYPTTTRYVPYISKQRVSSVATTGTTNHSPLSVPTQQPHHGDATSKLQVMNLKAITQNIGLDASSVGWAILEKLIHETDYSPEWNEIWHALSIDKVRTILKSSGWDPLIPSNRRLFSSPVNKLPKLSLQSSSSPT